MKTDPALQALVRALSTAPAASLWIADENVPLPPPAAPRPGCTALANRIDLCRALRAAGWDAEFSDIDLRARADASLAALHFRVAKEKPVTHHVINEAVRLLRPGGRLHLAGLKSEGIRTTIARARERLGGAVEVEVSGSGLRVAAIARGEAPGEALDDRDYHRLRRLADDGGPAFVSKPGVYGWDRIDPGSRRLAEQLTTLWPDGLPAATRVLDLGCGYGYLSLAAWRAGAAWVHATDNGAAALIAARANFERHGIRGEVSADDAGSAIEQRFELVLCNPPFHRGFGVEDELTGRFLAAAARLLAPGGTALFVVNRFIALERKAVLRFGTVETLADAGGFKVVRLSGVR